MSVWVGLLRAVNVSGANTLPMAGLRTLLADLGLDSPKTYIQSGNVVFRSPLGAPLLAQRIADAIHAGFGFRPPIFLLGQPQFQAALDSNPFPQAQDAPTHVHAFFLDRAMPDAGFAFLKALAVDGEAFAVRGKVLWLYLPHGIARSKMADRWSRMPIEMTARNYRSVSAIAELARKLAG